MANKFANAAVDSAGRAFGWNAGDDLYKNLKRMVLSGASSCMGFLSKPKEAAAPGAANSHAAHQPEPAVVTATPAPVQATAVAAAAVPPTVVAVTVPDGKGPGDSLTIQPPGGIQLQVVVPKGIEAGQTFQVQLPGYPGQPVPVAAVVA